MPTRITSHSATLIDHMSYYEGKEPSEFVELESGNFLSDLSNHLPNYTVLLIKDDTTKTARPLVRIFSQKNEDKCLSILNSVNWDIVCSVIEVNQAYDNFIQIVTDAFEASFTVTMLSRKRSRDKVWITSALKKSGRTKNAFYQLNKFLFTVGENLVQDLFVKILSKTLSCTHFVISQLIKVSLLNQLTREIYSN